MTGEGRKAVPCRTSEISAIIMSYHSLWKLQNSLTKETILVYKLMPGKLVVPTYLTRYKQIDQYPEL